MKTSLARVKVLQKVLGGGYFFDPHCMYWDTSKLDRNVEDGRSSLDDRVMTSEEPVLQQILRNGWLMQ